MAPHRLIILAVLLAATLFGGHGCGDVDPSQSLEAKSALTDDDIRHFLTRTHFGAKPGDVDAVRTARTDLRNLEDRRFAKPGEGLEAYVDLMLDYPPDDIFVPFTDEISQQALAAQVDDVDRPSTAELARWWLDIMVHTEDPFQEVLAMFWHNLFATSSEVLNQDQLYWMFDHVNLFRYDGNGNLRELLYKMSIDWAMLRWLDGTSSTDQNPNENFAREFYELFTLGVDNGYTQEDIVETSRAFTGFRIRTDPTTNLSFIEYDPDRHDPTDKVIFGETVTGRSGEQSYLEYLDMVNHTLANRPVAEFICTRLWEYFCYEDPEDEIIAQLSTILRDADYELRPVLRTIFLSEAFYSERSKTAIVKSPVEFAVGFIRTTGLEIPINRLDSRLSAIGQRPTQPPNVNGWPKGNLWLTGQAMLERANLIQECIETRDYQEDLGVSLDPLLPSPFVRTATNTITELAHNLDVQLSDEELEQLALYLNSDRNNFGGTFFDPFDGNDEEEIDKKVRGVLLILAQHPTATMR